MKSKELLKTEIENLKNDSYFRKLSRYEKVKLYYIILEVLKTIDKRKISYIKKCLNGACPLNTAFIFAKHEMEEGK